MNLFIFRNCVKLLSLILEKSDKANNLARFHTLQQQELLMSDTNTKLFHSLSQAILTKYKIIKDLRKIVLLSNHLICTHAQI